MANALFFDTLKFARNLKQAGLEAKVADAIADGFAEAISSNRATKADIAKLKAEFHRQLWIIGGSTLGLTVLLVILVPSQL